MGTRNDLIITGIGVSSGGDVGAVQIDGVGTINGALSCEEEFVVNGKATVKGGVEAPKTVINGMVTIEGPLRTEGCTVEGKLKMEGNLAAESIQINGSVTVHGSVEAERLASNGKLQMDSLNADEIKLMLQGSSSIREIGGGTIEVIELEKSSSRWLKLLPVSLENSLTAQVIEGDRIYLENTAAGVVRGAVVRIGPGCEIGLVEYKESFELSDGSVVKSNARL